MEYDKLTPSDFGLINMIGSLTQQDIKPEMNEDDTYTLRFKVSFDPDDILKKNPAIFRAIEGRASKRLVKMVIPVEDSDGVVTVIMRQSNERLPQYAAPNEYTKPYPGAGFLYCKRLEECRALQVGKYNIQQLILFVGGGEMEVPKDGPATFHFLNASGSVWAHAKEGDYIVAERPGHFSIVPEAEFKKIWERK